MADILREMDPATRAFLAIFLAITLKMMLLAWWDRYKTRQESLPTPMKLRNGVFVPWGRVDRIRRWLNIVTVVWVIWMVAMLGLLAYTKIMGYSNLF